MNTISHRKRGKKNRLQKKNQRLHAEQDELRETILENESEIAGLLECFDSMEREYKSKIHSLELELQFQRNEDTPTLRHKIINWIFFGVVASIYPLIVNILSVMVYGYKIVLSDIVPDFLFVHFAVSTNLISILFDSTKRGRLFYIILMALMYLSFTSFTLGECLSVASVSFEQSQVNISTVFLFALISLIIVVISGVIIIMWETKHNGLL